MRARTFGVVALAGVAATAVVRRRLRSGTTDAGRPAPPRSGWLSVTVYRDAAEVMPGGRVPVPLTTFGDDLEVEVRPAPGDKGSELRARLRPGTRSASAEGRGRLRAALREAKQHIEVGEVLRVDPTPHGKRSATPTGLLVDLVTARSNRGGTL